MRGPERINVVAPCLTLGKTGCARTQLVCTQQASRVKLGLCKAVTPGSRCVLETNPPFTCLQPSGPVSSFHESKLLLLDMVVQVGNSCAWAVPIPAASSILQSILPASHQALERCACSSGHPAPWSMGPGNVAAQEIDPLGCAVGMDAWEKSLASLSRSAAHPRLWCPVSFPRLHLTHLTGDPWLTTTLLHPLHPTWARGPRGGQGPLPTSSLVEKGPGSPSCRLLRSLPPVRGG